jgi:hypothetical protein
MTNRDWKEIENELNGLVPSLSQGEKPPLANYRMRQTARADEAAVLAHITDALTRENSAE